MLKKDQVRYLVISDLHLGHARNKTSDMIKALDTLFDDYKPRFDLDILFIAGDVFDHLLDFSLPEVSEIITWVHRLIAYCERSRIKLRVLEGTPSHDWGQSEIFRTVHEAAYPNANVKYVDTLSIEFIDDLGLSVLYIPDEWNSSTQKTLEQVHALLDANHLTQVDIGIFHGSFAFNLPIQAVKAPRHDEEAYLKIVKYFISIGHIHTAKYYQRILGQGSFDRLSHGEEEKKGGIECVIYPDGTGEHFFIENKLAKIFKTLNIKQKDIDNSILFIDKQTRGLPVDSYIRLRANKDHPVILGFDEIKKRFPSLVMSKITLEEEIEVSSNLIDEDVLVSDYVPITITKENIKALLLAEMNSKYPLSAAQLSIIDKTMSEVS